MSNIKANITKKQHYIPQFYLKLFADQHSMLQTLDVKNNRLCSPKSYSALGYAHYFYAVNTGIPDDISQHVEQWLSQFENIIALDFQKSLTKFLPISILIIMIDMFSLYL